MYSPLSSVKPVAGLPGSRSSGERGTGEKMRWAWATAFPLHVTLPRTVAMAGPPQPLDPIRTATHTQTAEREHARIGKLRRDFVRSSAVLSRRRPTFRVETLDLLIAEGTGHHQKLVHAAVEKAHGRVVAVRGDIPVAQLGVADLERDVEDDRVLRHRRAVDIVSHRAVRPVVDHSQVLRLDVVFGRQKVRGVLVSALAHGLARHAENERSGHTDLPMHLALVPAVGHHEGVVAVKEAVDIDPRAESEGVKLAGDAETDAVADAFEGEGLFAGP